MFESLLELLGSWRIHLAALNYSKQTLSSYTSAVTLYLRWCESTETTPLTRQSVEQFSAATLNSGTEPTTARLRHYALKSFMGWLAQEGEIAQTPFSGLRPPKMTTKVTPALTDDEIRSLLATCSGPRFIDRRDEAIMRFMIDSGVRSAELVAMGTQDIDLAALKAVVVKGKGGKGRVVPMSAQTAAAIDRYIRTRRKTAKPDVDALWLNLRGKPLTYDTLYAALRSRAAKAGLTDFHPHLTRNTAATRWLRHGGSESGLMAIAGWESRSMIDRYTRASASERALEESRRLGLGKF